MRNSMLCASIAGLLAVATGCGDGEPATQSETEPAGQPWTEDCSGPPTVAVTDPGTEPHTLMELSPEVGSTSRLDMRMTVDNNVEVDGAGQPAPPSPPLVMGVVITVDDVTEDDITMTFSYDKMEFEGEDDPAMEQVVDSLTSMTGTITTTRTGAFIDGGFNADSLDPFVEMFVGQFDQQLADMTIPLPGEPVGVGASWEVVSSVDAGGVAFCSRATYQLVEFDGDNYTLDVTVDQQAEPGTFSESGVTFEVLSGSGSSSGQVNGSLTLPFAVSGSTEATTQMEMKFQQGDQEHTQNVDITVELEVSPRE